ncbi:hypothetical protein HMPREF0185_00199 [Brevundimonas diminuta 470-4]|nr:hypothetical protein HMPREF0185_00199 [Brevundimonas diminuta 470-4]
MSGFFLIPGSPEHVARQTESAEREQQIDAANEARASAIDQAFRDAEMDREGAMLLELARLIDGSSFRSREEGLERVESMRRGPRGNDPDYQRVIALHGRIARMAPEYALVKARAVLSLVRSWGAV